MRKTQRQIPKSYKKISHTDRIRMIYLSKTHGLSLNEIAAELGFKYNSVRNIILAFEQCGRTNKKKYAKRALAPTRELQDAEDEVDEEDQTCGISNPQQGLPSSDLAQDAGANPGPGQSTQPRRLFNTRRLQALAHSRPEDLIKNMNSDPSSVRPPPTATELKAAEAICAPSEGLFELEKSSLVDVLRGKENLVYRLRLYVRQGPPEAATTEQCYREIGQSDAALNSGQVPLSEAPTRHCSPEGLNMAFASEFPAPPQKSLKKAGIVQCFSKEEYRHPKTAYRAGEQGEAMKPKRDPEEEHYGGLSVFDNRNKAYPYWRLNQQQMLEDDGGEVGSALNNKERGNDSKNKVKMFTGSLGFLNNVTFKSKMTLILQSYEKEDRKQALQAMKSLPLPEGIFFK